MNGSIVISDDDRDEESEINDIRADSMKGDHEKVTASNNNTSAIQSTHVPQSDTQPNVVKCPLGDNVAEPLNTVHK